MKPVDGIIQEWGDSEIEIDPEDLETVLDYESLVDVLFARWDQACVANARLTLFRMIWLEPQDFSPSEYMAEEDVGLRPSADILDRLSDLVEV